MKGTAGCNCSCIEAECIAAPYHSPKQEVRVQISLNTTFFIFSSRHGHPPLSPINFWYKKRKKNYLHNYNCLYLYLLLCYTALLLLLMRVAEKKRCRQAPVRCSYPTSRCHTAFQLTQKSTWYRQKAGSGHSSTLLGPYGIAKRTLSNLSCIFWITPSPVIFFRFRPLPRPGGPKKAPFIFFKKNLNRKLW